MDHFLQQFPIAIKEHKLSRTDILDYTAEDRTTGVTQWKEFLSDRFVDGADDDFDYRQVDEDVRYDELEAMEAQDAWFSGEEPKWSAQDGDEPTEALLQGETGIQDF